MPVRDQISLQDRLNRDAGIRKCYGCGADNRAGLKIKSFLEGDEGVCTWHAADHHCSYPGYLNGGIACTLIDCHSAWTAFALECRDRGISMERDGDVKAGWTRAMHVEFLKPTPLDSEITLRAQIKERGRTSRTVVCSLYADGQQCVNAVVTIVFP
jgi:acyl-coenzyme A thioesterase PaaI-like protein